MKKIVKILTTFLCVMVLASCGAKPEPVEPVNHDDTPVWQAVTIRDDLGREVTIEEEPQKVAALMGSFAETWVLAGGDLIAAPKDAWEDFELNLPESVENLGSYQKVSAEALFALDTDLIIASSNTKAHMELKDTLESAGLNVLYFDVNGFEDYLRMLKVCTDITGRADLYESNGTKVQEQVDKAKHNAQTAVNKLGAPRILFVRTSASGIHIKGSDGTVLGLMLKDLGCVNVADGSDLLENLSMEKIIEEDPDKIFIVMQGSDEEGARKTLEENLTGNPAWNGLTAVENKMVFFMDKKLYHLKPNNRWGTAYEQLEYILYGG